MDDLDLHSLKRALDGARRLAVRGHGDPCETMAIILAREVLAKDTGRSKDQPLDYQIDQATRDRLLAHTRRDAAHALINTITMMDDAWKARNVTNPRAQWLIFVIVMLAMVSCVSLTKPTNCRDGFVPTFVPFDGWACTAGYKP